VIAIDAPMDAGSSHVGDAPSAADALLGLK
jgi:hypothetical protein